MKSKLFKDISENNLTRSHRHCQECPAICCHDLAIEINRPRTKHQIENYKWYLHFDTVDICIRNHRWHLVIKGRCRYLDKNNLCTIYNERSEKCREHTPPACERYGQWYQVKISSPEALMEYLKPLASSRRKK